VLSYALPIGIILGVLLIAAVIFAIYKVQQSQQKTFATLPPENNL